MRILKTAAASVSLLLLAGCEPQSPAPANPETSPATTTADQATEGGPPATAAGTPPAQVPPVGGDPAEESATDPAETP